MKNEDNTLPLSKDKPMKIAVIGHMARQPIIGGGGRGKSSQETISPFAGISAALGVPSDSMSVIAVKLTKIWLRATVLHCRQEDD